MNLDRKSEEFQKALDEFIDGAAYGPSLETAEKVATQVDDVAPWGTADGVAGLVDDLADLISRRVMNAVIAALRAGALDLEAGGE